ncbi:MAG TPA: CRISPR-associated protein Cas4 [Kofleriaceae bacterium]|jgi:CRISPR-associated exonuclease Cas4
MEVDDDLPISALSHLVYCPRRAALVHVLGHWAENEHTTGGKLVHERIDEGSTTSRDGLRVLRSVHVRSGMLRLRGVIDALEIRGDGVGVRYVPVETKRGPRRKWQRDEIQLCAQAMAVEEMTGVVLEEGAIFHAASKVRRTVKLTAELRHATADAARRLHNLITSREVPPPVADERCPPCSLVGPCQPYSNVQVPTLREALIRSLTS